MKKNEGFTLIELIAVLVILALIALIVTPLVINIVKKSKQSANERSIDAYGKSLELSVASYLLEHKEYPTRLEGLKVDYTGSEVVCSIKILNKDGSIYLSECSVSGMKVKDASKEDGWYHYGKQSDIYIAYKTGDIVEYNNMAFYVIEDSGKEKNYVVLLKAEPLTYEEISNYSEDECININDYGAVTYYERDFNDLGISCLEELNNKNSKCCEAGNEIGCKSDYESSDIKKVVDVWAADKIDEIDLIADLMGYKVRLLSESDLINKLSFSQTTVGNRKEYMISSLTPNFVINNQYDYWIMNPVITNDEIIMGVSASGDSSFNGPAAVYSFALVRPVITLSKDAI